jgi:RNA polymerase sigma-70 factor (ECF subfamily)
VVVPADDVLVAGLRAGDEETFECLLTGWSGSMLRLARSFVSTAASAEEVVQDTWLAVLQGIEGFEGRSSLQTWVYRILVNIARKRGVRERRTVPWAGLTLEDESPAVGPGRFRGADDLYPGHWMTFPKSWASTESEVLAKEVRTTVAAAIESLPIRQQVVLTLRDIDGHDAEDVCALLGISMANQRVLLHRARSFVRGRLESYFSPSEAGP